MSLPDHIELVVFIVLLLEFCDPFVCDIALAIGFKNQWCCKIHRNSPAIAR